MWVADEETGAELLENINTTNEWDSALPHPHFFPSEVQFLMSVNTHTHTHTHTQIHTPTFPTHSPLSPVVSPRAGRMNISFETVGLMFKTHP